MCFLVSFKGSFFDGGAALYHELSHRDYCVNLQSILIYKYQICILARGNPAFVFQL